MQLRPDSFGRQLAGEPLRPIYLVAGAEPFLVQEAADAIRARAREEGYGEREIFDVDNSFDWNTLAHGLASLSLFATRRLFDVRMPTGKPGKEGSEALREYCESRRPTPSCCSPAWTGARSTKASGARPSPRPGTCCRSTR
jgi:DNA polymerase-3 subunit delta